MSLAKSFCTRKKVISIASIWFLTRKSELRSLKSNKSVESPGKPFGKPMIFYYTLWNFFCEWFSNRGGPLFLDGVGVTSNQNFLGVTLRSLMTEAIVLSVEKRPMNNGHPNCFVWHSTSSVKPLLTVKWTKTVLTILIWDS